MKPRMLLAGSGVVGLLCLLLLACKGQDPAPKPRQMDRPVSMPRERAPASTLPARQTSPPQGMVARDPYRPWQPEGLPRPSTPSYFEQLPTGGYRAYEPPRRGGPSTYQGYRFRPPDSGDREGRTTSKEAAGDRDGRPSYGREPPWNEEPWMRADAYGARSERFRPPSERERDRWSPGPDSPYGGQPYGDPFSPMPFLPQDAYGFQPGGW